LILTVLSQRRLLNLLRWFVQNFKFHFFKNWSNLIYIIGTLPTLKSTAHRRWVIYHLSGISHWSTKLLSTTPQVVSRRGSHYRRLLHLLNIATSHLSLHSTDHLRNHHLRLLVSVLKWTLGWLKFWILNSSHLVTDHYLLIYLINDLQYFEICLKHARWDMPIACLTINTSYCNIRRCLSFLDCETK
jgi:hypothetical protein